MDKTQAAAELGITPRTLERWTAQGRIAVSYEKGRARPVPICAEGDVAALKALLGNEGTVPPAAPTSAVNPTHPARATHMSTPSDKTTPPESRQTTAPVPPDDPVVLSMSEESLRHLAAEAAKRQLTVDAYVRTLLTGCEAGEPSKLRAQITELGEQVEELRKLVVLLGRDLASNTLVLLLNAGKIRSEDEAREWVQNTLKIYRHHL